MKPVLFVTGHAPFDRVGAFARLSEREGVEFALFGGRSLHGPSDDTKLATGDTMGDTALSMGDTALPMGDTMSDTALPFPHRHVEQRQIGRLAASGRYRAVVCSTGGRLALPAAWAGARRARVPLILWTSLWAHPRSAAHLFSYPALRRLYRSADAVVTYGPHVSAYVRARGARNVHSAPQSVDNAFWGAASGLASVWPAETRVKFLFAGRPTREKGLGVLIEAWSDSGLAAPSAALVLVGVGSAPPWIPAGGAVRRRLSVEPPHNAAEPPPNAIEPPPSGPARLADPDHERLADPGRRTPAAAGAPTWLNPVAPRRLRELYAAADVLLVPSIATRTFREPWGLVVNEAMNRKLPVIASDAVGAAAGGLVRDGRNGLVVPAGDTGALAGAIRRLAADAPLRARLGAAGAADVQAHTHDAWAGGFADALGSLGLSREGRW